MIDTVLASGAPRLRWRRRFAMEGAPRAHRVLEDGDSHQMRTLHTVDGFGS